MTVFYAHLLYTYNPLHDIDTVAHLVGEGAVWISVRDVHTKLEKKVHQTQLM